MRQTILIRTEAPAKPLPGAACNGCGVCCAAEPCPVGRLLPGNRRGPCRALEWRQQLSRYQCGMALHPARYLRWWPRGLESWLALRLQRRVGIGLGCDSDAEILG